MRHLIDIMDLTVPEIDELIVDEANGGALGSDSLADRFFREMMCTSGVPFFKRWIMWAGVALRTRWAAGGWRRWSILGWLLLSVLGVKNFFLLAFLAGLARFVPYVGPFVAWTTYGLVALFQTE